ncbi:MULTISPECIES: ABC transporter ATP-binding protein [Myxococcus]|uniref:ABC transporter ATP-binding protein n=1 Tax=Myxococcus TaxID=32 RepID=UPI0002ED2273|nr:MULTISPECIES: ABC transporter ATP-binding protein [Myxococcus]NOJ52689.1 ABC transporter ATP-binding protein [Myxococcus xanthus]QPM77222.1 ABC transporter ATP-binding protein [Myxococcus xanthus]QVW66291.1 ABC transporter ATP-binding protein [Myxococcus xanthus DZ2]QZZ52342.1 Dipeptide transport ATP-binding protein DppD [Myxococcus xanthus]UEO07582.1 ABC transporter ATP-binding protein [Myxococcus xanthus DZ2]
MTAAVTPAGQELLLDVRGLTTELALEEGPVRAVDDVSFALPPGGTLGVVGESGCGKSLTALSLLRLAPEPPVRVVGGEVRFQGRDLLTLPEAELRRVRGRHAAMIFQEPMTSLNPVFTVGEQIAEGVRLHLGASRAQARDKAVEMLRQVGIPAPAERVDAYPHQLSGGMRQRVMMAMALACDPALLIADEPTTALDVTIQAQILDLLARLQAERGMAVLLITHDLGVVAESCDAVVVMYAGRVVERAPVRALFSQPAHPYTAGLLRSIPSRRDVGGARASRARLRAIPGRVPPLRQLPVGCAFRERCERALDVCAHVKPALTSPREGQWAACHNPVPAP